MPSRKKQPIEDQWWTESTTTPNDVVKVGDATEVSSAVPLPGVDFPEGVVHLIVEYANPRDHPKRQANLSSCCMVSRLWYAASVGQLYEHPKLNSRNFDKFVQTICSSQKKSRLSRKHGLEKFVKRLDMGELAYESSKSITVRLLDHVKYSLQSFTPPAVTFNVASLSAVSKCSSLQELDLSKHDYDIDLLDILNVTSTLPLLKTLKMPRKALETRYSRLAQVPPWPKQLIFLQIPDWCPWNTACCVGILQSWPQNLKTLTIQNLKSYRPLRSLRRYGVTVDQIESLTISVPPVNPLTSEHVSDNIPLQGIFQVFPKLKALEIDLVAAIHRGVLHAELESSMNDFRSQIGRNSALEELTLTFHHNKPWWLYSADDIVAPALEFYVNKFSGLRRLVYPHKCMPRRYAGSRRQFDEILAAWTTRVEREHGESAGIFFFEEGTRYVPFAEVEEERMGPRFQALQISDE